MTRPECGSVGRDADKPSTNKTLVLELADLLPGSDERCADRLTHDLPVDGVIEEAHVIDGDTLTPLLCVHYDASAATAVDVQCRAWQVAETINSRDGHLRWLTTDVDEGTQKALEDRLSMVPGVVGAAATPDSIALEFERATVTAQELVDVIAAEAAPSPTAPTSLAGIVVANALRLLGLATTADCWWRRPGIYRSRYRPSAVMRRRWDAASPIARARDHAGNQRLNARWARFDQREKRPVVANAAIARELAGWCWSLAVLTD